MWSRGLASLPFLFFPTLIKRAHLNRALGLMGRITQAQRRQFMLASSSAAREQASDPPALPCPQTPKQKQQVLPKTPTKRHFTRADEPSGFTPKSVNVWNKGKRRRWHEQPVAVIGLGRALKTKKDCPPLPPHRVLSPSPGRGAHADISVPAPAEGSEEAEPVRPVKGSSWQRRRETTTRRWEQEIIPLLRLPYMRLMQETDNMRLPAPGVDATTAPCKCEGEYARRLSILVLRMTSECT